MAIGQGVSLVQSALAAGTATFGAYQLSKAVRSPEAYPGQTQGKITRELNKARDALRYGGPGEQIQLGDPQFKPQGFWQKVIFYTANVLRILHGYSGDHF